MSRFIAFSTRSNRRTSSTLLSLIWDTQVEIYSWLPLSSINSLRQVCRRLNNEISNDKKLWLAIIERDVLRTGLNLHPLRVQLADASAAHIRSWLKCTLYLQRAFLNNFKPIVTRIKVDHHVTWLKIVRTRWCLLASSSLKESKLAVWCLFGTPSMKKEYFLPGPVVEGLVEDDGDQIVVALTIGTTKMHVHVITVGISNDIPVVRTLAIVPNTSHVRLLRKSILICSVRDGDDTYPILLRWRENRCVKLLPRWFVEHANVPWGIIHSLVCAATVWLDYTVLIMEKTIEIFLTNDLEQCDESKSSPVASLPITRSKYGAMSVTNPDGIEIALIHNPQGRVSEEGHPLLHFSCRLRSWIYAVYSVVLIDRRKSVFALSEGLVSAIEMHKSPNTANMSTIGLSSNFEVHLHTRDGLYDLPSLDFISLERKETKTADRVSYLKASRPKCISEGFPLLHYTMAMDFDDGVGLLVIGTSRGLMCIARFLPPAMIVPGSLTDNLPHQRSTHGELNTVPVAMDIPSYYQFHENPAGKQVKNPELIRDVVKSWPAPERIKDISPWSCDWARFKNVHKWIAPANRWSILDPNYSIWNTTASDAYRILGILGDIVPLAYRLDPDFVLFRVGPRLYLYSTVVKHAYEEEPETFVRLSALPNLPLSVVLDGNLLDGYRRPEILMNMKRLRFSCSGLERLCGVVGKIEDLLASLKREPEAFEAALKQAGSDPDFWTASDMSKISMIWAQIDD